MHTAIYPDRNRATREPVRPFAKPAAGTSSRTGSLAPTLQGRVGPNGCNAPELRHRSNGDVRRSAGIASTQARSDGGRPRSQIRRYRVETTSITALRGIAQHYRPCRPRSQWAQTYSHRPTMRRPPMRVAAGHASLHCWPRICRSALSADTSAERQGNCVTFRRSRIHSSSRCSRSGRREGQP